MPRCPYCDAPATRPDVYAEPLGIWLDVCAAPECRRKAAAGEIAVPSCPAGCDDGLVEEAPATPEGDLRPRMVPCGSCPRGADRAAWYP